MNFQTVKATVGRFAVPVQIAYDKGRIYLKFGFNKQLVEATKDFAGRKWHGYDEPSEKMWSIPDNRRNRFRLEKFLGRNPFENWDKPLEQYPIPQRHEVVPFWSHQLDLYNHILTRKQAVLVGDMGTGKSRVAIAAVEHLVANCLIPQDGVWFVGPVNAVNAVSRELVKWSCPVKIKMFTYDGLVSYLKSYTGEAPKMVIFDEASKLKNWSTNRTKAAVHLVEAMFDEHGNDCYVVEMSGTPAPKAPTDWWSLVEIACAGFLKEASTVQLRNRLCLMEERENASGGMYPHIVTWFDDSAKCQVCGKYPDKHDEFTTHIYTQSNNELERLYKRLLGLVMIKRIDECLDLPELVRRIVRVKPTMTTLRAAQMIRNSDHRAAQKLILLRELSDGFQYQDVDTHLVECSRCLGTKEINEMVNPNHDPNGLTQIDFSQYTSVKATCPNCEGTGQVMGSEVKPVYVESPKDAFLTFLLDEYAEYGRFVVWAAFTASIDHVVAICQQNGWYVLRIDGRGLAGFDPTNQPVDVASLLDCMDYSNQRHNDLLREYDKVCVVSHPASGGMAYTFTSAPADLYYSNDFNAEAKIQSGARIRRGGMCTTRGVTSYEVVHLPEDMLVIDNLDKKKELQGVTLNDLTDFKFDSDKLEFFDGEKYV